MNQNDSVEIVATVLRNSAHAHLSTATCDLLARSICSNLYVDAVNSTESQSQGELSASFTPEWTPGPWAVTRVSTAAFNVRAKQDSIALVYIHQGSPSLMDRYSEGEANARLIAASPTMFAYIQRKAVEGDSDAAEIIASV